MSKTYVQAHRCPVCKRYRMLTRSDRKTIVRPCRSCANRAAARSRYKEVSA